jgi:hypothetical protein
MVLRHVVCVGCGHLVGGAAKTHESTRGLGGRGRFLCFALPSPDDIACNGEEVVGGDEGRGRDGGSLVNNGRLDVALDRLDCGSLYPSN